MKKFSIILGAIILMLFVTLVIWGVYCDNTIAITNYCVNNAKNDAKLKFVVITDLHNKEYGVAQTCADNHFCAVKVKFAFVIFRKKSLIRSDYSADER